MPDIITIGSATVDVFVRCDDANIVSVCSTDKKSEFMSYPYGSKIDITNFDSTVGGGGVNTAVYFAAVGGAGALLSKCIKKSEVIAYDDLGTEAIRKLYVENLPVITVIDCDGNNLYETAPEKYKRSH